jgi:hypothetical protein
MSQPPPPGWSAPGAPDAPTQYLPISGSEDAGRRPPPEGPPPGHPAGPPRRERAEYEPIRQDPSGYPADHFPPAQLSRATRSTARTAVWVLGLVSIAATVLGLTVKEDGHNAWSAVHAWGAVAILGAVLTLAPVVAGSAATSPRRAWQTAACGAAALGLFWVLFVLPSVGTNTSLLATIGVAAGIIAVWIGPGRQEEPEHPAGGPTW